MENKYKKLYIGLESILAALSFDAKSGGYHHLCDIHIKEVIDMVKPYIPCINEVAKVYPGLEILIMFFVHYYNNVSIDEAIKKDVFFHKRNLN